MFNDEETSLIAKLGFVVFIIIVAVSGFAQLNRNSWTAETTAFRQQQAEGRAQSEAAQAEAERQRAQAETEAAHASRVQACTDKIERVKLEERERFESFLSAYDFACGNYFERKDFERMQRRLTELHERFDQIRPDCSDVMTVERQLNGRSLVLVNAMTCEGLATEAHAFQNPPEIAGLTGDADNSLPNEDLSSRQAATAEQGWTLETPSMPVSSSGDFPETDSASTGLELKSDRDVPVPAAEDANDATSPKVLNWKDIIWRDQPSERQISSAMPTRADKSDFPAEVMLNCLIKANGKLSCEVLSERPTGKGFGDAALKLSKNYKASPLSQNGEPTPGASVVMLIGFEP